MRPSPLPVGIQDFAQLREGNQPLFNGLWIHEHWDWSVHRPVVRISFGAGKFQQRGELIDRQRAEVDQEAERLGVALDASSAQGRFAQLLYRLSLRGARPVVLIDDYDGSAGIANALQGGPEGLPTNVGSDYDGPAGIANALQGGPEGLPTNVGSDYDGSAGIANALQGGPEGLPTNVGSEYDKPILQNLETLGKGSGLDPLASMCGKDASFPTAPPSRCTGWR